VRGWYARVGGDEIHIVCQRDINLLLLFSFCDGGEPHHGRIGLDLGHLAHIVIKWGWYVEGIGVHGFSG